MLDIYIRRIRIGEIEHFDRIATKIKSKNNPICISFSISISRASTALSACNFVFTMCIASWMLNAKLKIRLDCARARFVRFPWNQIHLWINPVSVNARSHHRHVIHWFMTEPVDVIIIAARYSYTIFSVFLHFNVVDSAREKKRIEYTIYG